MLHFYRKKLHYTCCVIHNFSYSGFVNDSIQRFMKEWFYNRFSVTIYDLKNNFIINNLHKIDFIESQCNCLHKNSFMKD